MTKDYNLRLDARTASAEEYIKEYIARQDGIDVRTINCARVLRRSIDARGRQVVVNLTVRAFIGEEPADGGFTPIVYNNVEGRPRVVVVGEGPGGLFAALKLIELGLRPVVVERGKDVRERKKDLALISRRGSVDPESNYCFGEGGAGAYSDGKLYTRSKKRGENDRILGIFCQMGASTAILSDAHPHIGTDRLPAVIERMRETIVRCGGEVHHQTRMTGLLISGDEVVGIEAVDLQTEAERTFRGPVVLATGHSARDIYRYMASQHIEIEAKGIAVGVRLEHPAKLIDQIQYHSPKGRGQWLPAAEYSMLTRIGGRAVYSFCMCPGGFIVPAATGPRQVVVNGMSPASRGGAWSNSGMVVETLPEDIEGDDPLRLMRYQEQIERDCWQQGGMSQTAPAQRMADFVAGKLSYDLPRSSYAPGLVSSPLHFWLPKPVAGRLQEGFKVFGRNARGFLTNDATLIAAETRTSSPVRIPRDKITLMHIRLGGLFPCGEGAGYAGGIVSAAIDGERCAQCCADYLDAK